MQIFRLHENPAESASLYPDTYTYNQLREGEQILRLALYPDYQHPEFPVSPNNSHLKHPIVQWAANSLSNWVDTYLLLTHVNDEYQSRYGSSKSHKSFERLPQLYPHAVKHLPRTGYTLQPCAFDAQYKIHPEPETLSEVAENYRNYVREVKAPQDWFSFDKTNTPDYIKCK